MVNWVWDNLPDSEKIKLATAIVERARLGDGRSNRLPSAIGPGQIVRFFNGQTRLAKAEERMLLRLARNSNIIIDSKVAADNRYVIGLFGAHDDEAEEEPPKPTKPTYAPRGVDPNARSPAVITTLVGMGLTIFSLLYSFAFSDLELLIGTFIGLATAYCGILWMALEG